MTWHYITLRDMARHYITHSPSSASRSVMDNYKTTLQTVWTNDLVAQHQASNQHPLSIHITIPKTCFRAHQADTRQGRFICLHVIGRREKFTNGCKYAAMRRTCEVAALRNLVAWPDECRGDGVCTGTVTCEDHLRSGLEWSAWGGLSMWQHDTTLPDMTWHYIAVHEVKSQGITWHDITLHHITLHDMTWHCIT